MINKTEYVNDRLMKARMFFPTGSKEIISKFLNHLPECMLTERGRNCWEQTELVR